MSRIKEHYFNELNLVDEIKDMIDEDYFYELWIQKIERDEYMENYIKENEERETSERIFNLTNTYPF